jgi:endonuclease IV
MRVVSHSNLKQLMTTDVIGLGYPAESILVHGSYLINLGCVILPVYLSPG